MIASPNAAAMPVSPSEPPRSLFTTIAPQPAKTSVNVANASATQRRPSDGLPKELEDQCRDASVDLVPDPPHRLEILTGRIVEGPSPCSACPGRWGTRHRSPS